MGKVISIFALSVLTAFIVGYMMGSSKKESLATNKSASIALGYLITEADIASAKTKEKEKEKVVYREVIKYIQNPDRKRCDFDADAVRLRQQAIDSANSVPGFDVATMQDKRSGSKQ